MGGLPGAARVHWHTVLVASSRPAPHAATAGRWRHRSEVACVAVIVLAVVLGAWAFVRSRSGTTPFGSQLGGDFAEFYDAGQALNQGHARLLYDPTDQQRRYHRLFPRLPASDALPYLYPPLAAEAFRPIAHLSYRLAFALWLVVSLALYGLGLWLAWRAVGGIPPPDRRTVLLLCLAFEPFLFEAVLGGQLSTVAFAAWAGFLYLQQRGRPLAASAVLGLCVYKPTLLVFALPLLVSKRQWRMVAGLVTTAVVASGASVAALGWTVNRAYGRALRAQLHATNGVGSVVVRRWKFVDLNAFLRLLAGDSTAVTVAVVATMAATLVLLHRRMDALDAWPRRELDWAAVVVATVCVNVYVGAYDLVLVVLAGLLTYDALRRQGAPRKVSRPWLGAIGAVVLAAWISQPLARSTGLQVLTLCLVGLLAVQIRLLRFGPPALAF